MRETSKVLAEHNRCNVLIETVGKRGVSKSDVLLCDGIWECLLIDMTDMLLPSSLSVQGVPKPIAVEPCWGSRAGVLTVLLCLPRLPSGIPPPGQSGKHPSPFHSLSGL